MKLSLAKGERALENEIHWLKVIIPKSVVFPSSGY